MAEPTPTSTLRPGPPAQAAAPGGLDESVRDPVQPHADDPPGPAPAADGPGLGARLCQDMRLHWQQGDRVGVEDYLAAGLGSLDDDAVLDLLFNEVLLREEQGDF